MKVLIECFIPTESGPVFTYGMAKGLIDNDIEVFAIISDDADNIKDWKRLLDECHLYCVSSNIDMRNHLLASLTQLYLIKKRFKNIKFDYYIDTFPSVRLRYLKHAIDYKISIAIDHDVKPHSSVDGCAASRVRELISEFQSIIVLSKSFIGMAQNKYDGEKKEILYMRHGAMEYPAYQGNNIENNNKINFMYFGRIDGYKGLHVLAEAYRELSSQYKDISLTVAGGGDFSEYVEDYKNLENCTVLNKYITDEEIAYLFSVPKTVVVLPYLDATQSGVIGMAFHYKTPVIVSDTGGLREQLFDGEVGLFVEPGNSIDLKQKMETFLINEHLYKEQVALMNKCSEKSTWSYVTRELLKQLEKKL